VRYSVHPKAGSCDLHVPVGGERWSLPSLGCQCLSVSGPFSPTEADTFQLPLGLEANAAPDDPGQLAGVC
jgi:hypothetical protein